MTKNWQLISGGALYGSAFYHHKLSYPLKSRNDYCVKEGEWCISTVRLRKSRSARQSGDTSLRLGG